MNYMRRELVRLAALPSRHREALLTCVVLGFATTAFLYLMPEGYPWVVVGIISASLGHLGNRVRGGRGTLYWFLALGAALGSLLVLDERLVQGSYLYAHFLASAGTTFSGLYFLFATPKETELDRVLRRRVPKAARSAPAPQAPGYAWSCHRCETGNAGDAAACVQCGAPAYFRVDDQGREA
jgi:hypothetical protein